jgi:hypothetical protein
MGWCCCCPFGQPFFSIADRKGQEEQALDAASNMVNLKIEDPELVPGILSSFVGYGHQRFFSFNIVM